MTPTDSLTRRLALMATDARTRGFGASEPRMEAWITHGYLLALEEIEAAVADLAPRQTESPRDHR